MQTKTQIFHFSLNFFFINDNNDKEKVAVQMRFICDPPYLYKKTEREKKKRCMNRDRNFEIHRRVSSTFISSGFDIHPYDVPRTAFIIQSFCIAVSWIFIYVFIT